MLASAHRLRRSVDFAETVRGGRRAGRALVVVHVLAGGTEARQPAWTQGSIPARAGFVVGKNVGSAVVRNKVRRRLRDAMREPIKQMAPGARVVIRALPAAATADFGSLSEQVEAAVRAALASEGRRTGSRR